MDEDEASDSQAQGLLPGNDDIDHQGDLQYEDGVIVVEERGDGGDIYYRLQDASDGDLGGEPPWQGDRDDCTPSEEGSEYDERPWESSRNVLPSDADAGDTRDTRYGGNADDTTYRSASALGVCAGRALGVGTKTYNRFLPGRGGYETGRHGLGSVGRDTPGVLRPYCAGRRGLYGT